MNIERETAIWNDFDEVFILKLLEKTYRKLNYTVTNFHETDRVHEDGVDLLCEKGNEKIAIQVKVKPRKEDIEQFKRFERNTGDKKSIYINIRDPTRPFKDFVETCSSNVEFWDRNRLHKFLVENESIEYYCLYFSTHPLILSLKKAHELFLKKRNTSYTKHKFTSEEIAKLWVVKDNSVKVRISLYFIHLKWNKILMGKTEKKKEEFEPILNAIFEDLDMAYNLSGDKLISSVEDLSEKHPDLIGLLWKLCSERTGWNEYTTLVEKAKSLEESLSLTWHYWICPVFNESKTNRMRGFYSSMNYLLEHFHEIAENIEDGIDWVFAKIVK